MAVKDAEKSKEATEETKGSEQDKPLTAEDKAAQELLDELKAEETAEKDKPSSTDDAEKDKEKGESEAESEGEKEASDDAESQTAKKQKPKRGFARRSSRLVKQRDGARTEAEQSNQALIDEKEAGKLKDLRIQQLEEQTQSKAVEPNPDNFDGGVDDPDFVAKKKEFDNANLKKLVSEQVAQVANQSNETALRNHQANDLKQKQEDHWKQADEMGNQDYDEKEEQAIDTMGKEMVNHIIANCQGDSHKVIYYLGANEEEAAELSEMLAEKSTMVKGVLKLGQIQAKLTSNPQNSFTPDPDVETEGSAPSAQESLQAQLEKLLENAQQPGGLRKVLDLKKRARERGITLV